MKQIIPTIITGALLSSCGGSRQSQMQRHDVVPTVHAGTYEVSLRDTRSLIDTLPDCGLGLSGEYSLEVTVKPPHITVDNVPDDAYDESFFELSVNEGVRYVSGYWAVFPVIININVSADGRRALGSAKLVVEVDGFILCAEQATITGTFTPSR